MRLYVAAALAALLILTACSGGSPAPTPTPTPRATPTAAPSPTASATADGGSDLGPAAFDPARAFAHVEALASDIGSRPAGSEAERSAARYLRDQLLGFGYQVELQPFTFDVFQDTGSSLNVLSPQAPAPAVYPFEPSANGAVEGQLVEAGIGRPDDFPADTAGKIVLIRRGILFFSDKVTNAEAAGAVGAVIYNNEPGLFSGILSKPSAIPVLAVSEADGEALLEMLGSGPASVRLEVKTETGLRRSQNVIARPEDGRCRVLAGGHYDSVPAGPGANDNASGTATVLEMARVLAADGELDDACFVLFGAEEVGLIGSASFVDALTPAEAGTLEAMLNFDMVSVGTRLLLTGSPALARLAADQADELGIDHLVGSSATAGSDHASFIEADIPAVFFHSVFRTPADDPAYHTAEDRAENVRATRMAEIADAALALIDALLGTE